MPRHYSKRAIRSLSHAGNLDGNWAVVAGGFGYTEGRAVAATEDADVADLLIEALEDRDRCRGAAIANAAVAVDTGGALTFDFVTGFALHPGEPALRITIEGRSYPIGRTGLALLREALVRAAAAPAPERTPHD